MRPGERSQVSYSQTERRNAHIDKEGEEGGAEACCKRRREHTHTRLSSRILYTRKLNSIRRAVLELYSCPCALSSLTLWMDGGQSQMFPLECQHFFCGAAAAKKS